MEQEVQEYLVFLRQNASELRQLGKEWDLSDAEINGCIKHALKNIASNDLKKETPKNFMRRIWSYFRFLVKVLACSVAAVILFIMFVAVVCAVYEPADAYVSKFLMPYSYGVFRYVRLSTLPLHHMVNLTSFYDAECLVDNPWFEEDIESSGPCWNCEAVAKVTRINMSEEVYNKAETFHYINEMKPVLFQKSLSKNVTYHDLRSLYFANQELLNDNEDMFQSDELHVNTLEDLFQEDIEKTILAKNKSSVDWNIKGEGSSKILEESVFPNPAFLQDDIEVSTEKTIFIDGPKCKTLELPRTVNRTWHYYTQGSGTRRIVLKPIPECSDMCSALLISVNAGDTLMFTFELWRVYLLTNGEGISVGLLSSFLI